MKLPFPSKAQIRAFSRYLFVGAIVFFVGLVWNFPYEKVRVKLTTLVTKKTGYLLDMEELSPALPLGFVAKNARLSGGAPIAGMPVDLEFKSLRVTLSPFSLLLYPVRKSVTVSYTARLDNSKWSGSISPGKNDSGAEIGTSGFALNQKFPIDTPQAREMAGGNPMTVGVEAKVDLDLELEGPTAGITRSDFSAADGSIQLTATKVTISLEPELMKPMQFDKVVVKGEVTKGKLDIKSITLAGPDLSGTASGSMKIEPYIARSNLQLDAKLTLSEKATGLRTLVSTIGSSQWGLRMDDKGTVVLKVTGPVQNLQVSGY